MWGLPEGMYALVIPPPAQLPHNLQRALNFLIAILIPPLLNGIVMVSDNLNKNNRLSIREIVEIEFLINPFNVVFKLLHNGVFFRKG